MSSEGEGPEIAHTASTLATGPHERRRRPGIHTSPKETESAFGFGLAFLRGVGISS